MVNRRSKQIAVAAQFRTRLGCGAYQMTGGGCSCIYIPLKDGAYLQVTDGQAEVPVADEFDVISVQLCESDGYDVEGWGWHGDSIEDAIQYCAYMLDLMHGRI